MLFYILRMATFILFFFFLFCGMYNLYTNIMGGYCLNPSKVHTNLDHKTLFANNELCRNNEIMKISFANKADH